MIRADTSTRDELEQVVASAAESSDTIDRTASLSVDVAPLTPEEYVAAMLSTVKRLA